MPEAKDSIQYQRTILGTERSVSLFATTDPPTITISVVRGDEVAFRVSTEGRHGADLLVALSSAYTAASQGCEAHAKVGDLFVESRQIKGGPWAIFIDNPVSGVRIPVEITDRVIMSLQILLNDVTGEYRRQISEYEKAAS